MSKAAALALSRAQYNFADGDGRRACTKPQRNQLHQDFARRDLEEESVHGALHVS